MKDVKQLFNKIEFARTPCYGTCPVFDVEIRHDGTVKWNGHMHVACPGKEEFKISKNKIKKLEGLLEEFDYRSYTYPKPDVFATDHPSCITRVEFSDGYVKEVDHYLGDMESNIIDVKHSLHSLEKFENKIERLIGIQKFITHPPMYVYHLKTKGYESIVCAPNEKEALRCVQYENKEDKWDIIKFGRAKTEDMMVFPYVVMDKRTEE